MLAKKIRGNMIEIFITKNKIALVDDEDFEELNKFSWQILWSKTSNTFYARRQDNNGKTILMHRAIMKVEDRFVYVDHKNFNGLHNYKNNLRIATPSQNMQNR